MSTRNLICADRRLSGLLAGVAVAAVLVGSSASAETERPSGTLVVAWPEVYSYVGMPSRNGGRQGERLVWLGVNETPLYVTDGVEVVPHLAESWTISEDGLRHTVKLREGVQFHGGFGEMTAEDLKWTAEDQWSPDSNHGGQFIARTNLEEINIIDDYTVEFVLQRPNAFFREYYGTLRDDVAVAIYSKKRAEELGLQAATTDLPHAGTGPYQVERWTADSEIILKAFPDYWGEQPAYETIRIVQISEPSTVLAALETGQVDMARIPVTARERVEAAGLATREAGLGFARIVFAGQFCVTEFDGQEIPPRPGYDPSKPWIGDCDDPASMEQARQVRHGMSQAIDREALVEVLAGGHGRPAYVDNLVGYLADRHMKPEWAVPFDPERAKEIFAEAGHPNGFPVTFVCDTTGHPLLGEFCEAIGGMWISVGLQVQIQRMAGDARRMQQVERSFNNVFLEVETGVTPIPEARGFGEIPTAAFNSGYEVSGLVELVRQASVAVTDEERDRIRDQQYQWVFDNHYIILAAEFDEVFAYNPEKVGEWPRTPYNGHSSELMDFEKLEKPE